VLDTPCDCGHCASGMYVLAAQCRQKSLAFCVREGYFAGGTGGSPPRGCRRVGGRACVLVWLGLCQCVAVAVSMIVCGFWSSEVISSGCQRRSVRGCSDFLRGVHMVVS